MPAKFVPAAVCALLALSLPALLPSGSALAGGDDAPAAQCDDAVVMSLDVVDLHRAVETVGREDLAVTHGSFVYWFANEANRDAFIADPATYRIQWGGACGRMGPLSGKGSTTRHAVHDGRLYIFASDSCRDTFLKSPEKFVESDDARPRFDAASIERARAALDRAQAALGGPAFAAMQDYTEFTETMTKSGQADVRTTKTLTLAFPGNFRREETWGEEYKWGEVVTPADAFQFSQGKDESLESDQRAALLRLLAHHPVVILKSRAEPGFTAGHAGAGEVDSVAVEFVDVWLHGAATRLAIDAASGRLVSASYRARGGNLTVGAVEVRFADWRDVGGVHVPFVRTFSFEGQRAERMDERLTTVGINSTPDPAAFARTAGPGA